MTSLRDSVTAAALEASSGFDYSAQNINYKDTFIEEKISEAELLVETKVDEVLSSSSSSFYKTAVKKIAAKIIRNDMIDLKILKDQTRDDDYFDKVVMVLITEDQEDEGCDIIPMVRNSRS